MKFNPNVLSAIAIFISIIAVPASAYFSFLYARKAFLFEMKEQDIYKIIQNKNRFISDIILFGRTDKTLAEVEFGTDFSKKAYVAECEKLYEKLFSLGIVSTLYKDIEDLNSRNFDVFLSKYDQGLYDGYKSFELSKNNPDISNAKKAHLVYQLFFENKLLDKLSSIQDINIREYYSDKNIIQKQVP